MARERTGSIVNRKGVLFARVSYVDATGKRREVTRKALDRADARRIIDELHARLDQHGGEAVLNDRSALSAVIEQYRKEKAIPAVIRDGRKIAGLKSHYTVGLCLDVIVEHLGAKKLRDIKPSDLHRFKQQRLATKTQYKRERTVAAVHRELETLRAVCRWAVNQGWLQRSPFTYGDPVINKSHEASRDRVLTHDEEKRLLDACTGRRAYLRAIVVMALDTCMRRGELFQLRWKDVNVAEGVAALPAEITKTQKPRAVPLTQRVLAELEALRKGNSSLRPNGLTEDLKGLGEFVFGPLDIRYAWAKVCEEAGLENFHFHDLRHSGVTRLIEAGVNPALAMSISGHDNMKTFQKYLNPQTNMLRDVADKLHDLNRMHDAGRESDEGYVN